MHKIGEASCRENIHVDTYYVVFTISDSIKHVMYKPRLAYTTWGCKGHVSSICQGRYQFAGFFLPVTEIVRSFISIYEEWIGYSSWLIVHAIAITLMSLRTFRNANIRIFFRLCKYSG